MDKYIYHYNLKALDILKTLRKQGITHKETQKYENYAKKVYGKPYCDHISFFIKPIPFENIATYFNNKHSFWKNGQSLIEHRIKLSAPTVTHLFLYPINGTIKIFNSSEKIVGETNISKQW